MIKNKLLKTSSLIALIALTGCQENLIRHDGVTTSAGDQLAINEAKLVADPWKRRAYDNHIEGDGQRNADVVKRYKEEYKVEEKSDSPDLSQLVGLPAPAPGK